MCKTGRSTRAEVSSCQCGRIACIRELFFTKQVLKLLLHIYHVLHFRHRLKAKMRLSFGMINGSFTGTDEHRVWRSRREESDRVVSFEAAHRRRFFLNSLCLLSSLCFLFVAASLSRYGWYWHVPGSLAANSSGPLQVPRHGV